MTRSYQNSKLIKHFEKHISCGMKVKEVYKPLLVDILLRRAYEFSLSPEEIEQDLQTLLKSLDSIVFKKMSKEDRNTFGEYDFEKKQIILNQEFVRRALKNGNYGIDEVYVTLTHEVYHALCRDEKGRDRLSSINMFDGKENGLLLETIIETAADRTVFSRTEKDRYNFRKETKGYPAMTFIVPAIAATYGVSEKEFLKHALFGRDNLVRFLSNQVGESTNKTISYLDTIELHLRKMYRAVSFKGKKAIVRKRARELIVEAMIGISNTCNCKLEERYEKENPTDINSAYNFVEKAKYNHIKLHQILDMELETLRKEHHIDVIKMVEETKQKLPYDEIKSISQMDRVLSARKNFKNMTDFSRAFRFAKRGALESLGEEELLEFGIYNGKVNTISSVDENVIREFDEDDFIINIPWNNACIEHYISKYISKLLPIRGIVRFLNDTIEEHTYGSLDLLPQQGNIDSDEKNVFRLSDTDLERFNIDVKKVLKQYGKISSKEKVEGEFICSKS